MFTAELFRQAGYPIRAKAMRDVRWLSDHRRRIEFWARECGIAPEDLKRALDKDLGAIVPPDHPFTVDVVMPVSSFDMVFCLEALSALLRSNHCVPTIHVVMDSAWIDGIPQDDRIRLYRTDGGAGPYRIVNALVAQGHVQSEFFAQQDADDVSSVDRLWKQMTRIGLADCISSAAENFIDPGSIGVSDLESRLAVQPVWYPGMTFLSAPLGACVNPTRLIRLESFKRLNGYIDWFCNADFHFDTRLKVAGGTVVDDREVLARRRLHHRSITNGMVPLRSPQRMELQDMVQRHINELKGSADKLSTARTMGALHLAEFYSLERIQ